MSEVKRHQCDCCKKALTKIHAHEQKINRGVK